MDITMKEPSKPDPQIIIKSTVVKQGQKPEDKVQIQTTLTPNPKEVTKEPEIRESRYNPDDKGGSSVKPIVKVFNKSTGIQEQYPSKQEDRDLKALKTGPSVSTKPSEEKQVQQSQKNGSDLTVQISDLNVPVEAKSRQKPTKQEEQTRKYDPKVIPKSPEVKQGPFKQKMGDKVQFSPKPGPKVLSKPPEVKVDQNQQKPEEKVLSSPKPGPKTVSQPTEVKVDQNQQKPEEKVLSSPKPGPKTVGQPTEVKQGHYQQKSDYKVQSSPKPGPKTVK
ncbi:nucleolar protein dao-5-like [Pecten maximus]|uniref:nucleolar protein dao-5-like n=1 Tax=Pecten maximus TaxID=6579 RepID=UPI001458033B|nr:nucleolar protein dao-5-like [Pecten maximus]